MDKRTSWRSPRAISNFPCGQNRLQGMSRASVLPRILLSVLMTFSVVTRYVLFRRHCHLPATKTVAVYPMKSSWFTGTLHSPSQGCRFFERAYAWKYLKKIRWDNGFRATNLWRNDLVHVVQIPRQLFVQTVISLKPSHQPNCHIWLNY